LQIAQETDLQGAPVRHWEGLDAANHAPSCIAQRRRHPELNRQCAFLFFSPLPPKNPKSRSATFPRVAQCRLNGAIQTGSSALISMWLGGETRFLTAGMHSSMCCGGRSREACNDLPVCGNGGYQSQLRVWIYRSGYNRRTAEVPLKADERTSRLARSKGASERTRSRGRALRAGWSLWQRDASDRLSGGG
jgi:hypothetical protein